MQPSLKITNNQHFRI